MSKFKLWFWRLSGWLRRKVRKWLGLGETFIGVDLALHGQSCIVVCSRLQDGRMKIIDTHFNNIREMEELVRHLQHRWGVPDRDTIVDGPQFYRGASR